MRNYHIQLKDILNNKVLLYHLPLALFFKDRDGKYLGANRKYLDAINLEEEEKLIGFTDFDLVSEEDAQYFDEADSLVLTGATYEVRTPIHEKENNHYHVATTKIPLYEGNRVVGLVGMFHDLGPQELQILDEYKTGEALLKEKILNGINSAIFILDIESESLIRANIIGDKILAKCDEKDKSKLLFDLSWGMKTANKENDIAAISIKNSTYIESLNGYFTLTYGEIEWEDKKAYIRYINDVTQLIDGERDAQLMLSQLNLALSHSNLIFFDYSLKTGITHTSEYAQEILLIDDNLVNFPDNEQVKRIINPEHFDLYKSSFEIVKSGLKDYVNFESMTLFGDKEYRWRDIKISAIYDNEGRRNKIIITGSDLDRYKKLESRLHTILANNNIASWEFDIERDLILLNSDILDLDILSEQEIPLEMAFNALYKDDLPNYKKMFQDIKDGAESSSSEYRLMTKNDEFVWFHSEITVLKKLNGISSIAIGSSRNINKLKLAEKRYNDDMTFLRLRNESQLIYCLMNLSTNQVIAFSSTNDKLQEYGQDNLLEKFYSTLSSQDDINYFKENFSNNLQDNFSKGINSTTKVLKLFLFNKLMYIKLSMKVIQNPETLDLMCFISGEDVDIEVKTQQMLQLSADQNYELSTRLDFPNDEMIVHANKDSIFNFDGKLSVFTIKEGLDRFIKPLNVTQERMDNLEQYFHDKLKSNNPAFSVFTVKDDDGIEYIKRSKIIYIDKENSVFGEFWDDITEVQRQNEIRNKQLANALVFAQSANSAKTIFLSSMSHDIRTPLNAIIGMNNLALEDINNKEQVEESLNIIRDSSKHLLSLINDILDLSRIESNKIAFNIQPYNAYDILNESSNRMKVILSKKKQHLITDFKINNPLVLVDKAMSCRIIENIINNSSKFSDVDKNIYLTVSDVVSDNDKYNKWTIVLRDDGVGMNKEELDNVFNPFYRTNHSIVNNIEGTGLGLAIVKKNLAEIGGEIKIESSEGVGTTITIETPIKIQSDNDTLVNDIVFKGSDKKNDILLSGKRVLLVEDNKINMLLASKILDKFNIIITKEYNGKDALERFKNSPSGYFDCILTDIMMPIMDGITMVKEIREYEGKSSKSIPIIAMTANAFVSDIRECLACGMNAHLSKPIDVDELKFILLKHIK
jgi:signal transduction histidine kinase/PAS domain-containing protein/ActR/RegA family two-component response regulator